MMIEYTSFSLPNGLRVVHNYDANTSQCAVNMLYDVGSRDESPHRTGMAHLFEHLMFGGSVNVPDFDYAIDMASGTNNAFTSTDVTCFYDILPSENIATALWAESDRLLSPLLESSLEVQRRVVIEEFKQTCLNKPYGDAGHHLRSLLYESHPYRWPTIGLTPRHIEQVTPDDIHRFFQAYYSPQRAVLAVSGSVTLDILKELANKYFSDIPSRTPAPHPADNEPPVTSPRRLTVKGKVPQARIYIAFHAPALLHPDYPTSDIITDILASGRSSRFYRQLVMNSPLFTHADACVAGTDHTGYLLVTAHLADASGQSVDRAEKMLWEQLDDFILNVSDTELQRALIRFDSNRTFSHLNFTAKARELAYCALRQQDINEISTPYQHLTKARIRRIASDIINRQRACTLIYLPENA
ncbi:MAG: insulinase family protein [Paramuribaculum sp.]|nr:insulinase family protein [Paramuribaculum sp.]